MQREVGLGRGVMTRRAMLGAASAVIAVPALAAECQIGPPPHAKGPRVFMDYDQVELDAAYDQEVYQPWLKQVSKRLYFRSADVRSRLKAQRAAYGTTADEKLDIYRTKRAKAPIFVFLHGGTWRFGSAQDSAHPAEMFVKAGAHYVAPDFVPVQKAGGDLGVMAAQVRRAIAWVYQNAASFGGDPDRLYLGGHSSGGHLCGVALVTDWAGAFGLPADIVKGGLCMSGIYDMAPVQLSYRRNYVKFTEAMADAMSPQRHIGKLRTPVVVTYGTLETPEFQRQSREFAAAVKAAGKPVELIEAQYYAHEEMVESLGDPYGPNGRAALALMKLAS